MKPVKLFEEFMNEALSQKDFDKAVTDLAYSMPNHTKYDTDGLPSDEQIMKAMQKYQKALYKYTSADQKKDVIEKVKELLSESIITEGKVIAKQKFSTDDDEAGEDAFEWLMDVLDPLEEFEIEEDDLEQIREESPERIASFIDDLLSNYSVDTKESGHSIEIIVTKK